jgi:hypothetical protein
VRELVWETPYFSYAVRELPRGCQLCVRGEKLVLFTTGACPRDCFYCPLSPWRRGDVVYANERPVKNVDDVIEEARIQEAKGAGITGGDPLARLDRTVEYIRVLKENFGKDVVNELGREKKVLYLTGGVLIFLGLLTPLPITTAVVGSLFLIAAWYASRGVPQEALAGPAPEEAPAAPAGPVLSTPEEVADEIFGLLEKGVKKRAGIVDWSDAYEEVLPYLNL